MQAFVSRQALIPKFRSISRHQFPSSISRHQQSSHKQSSHQQFPKFPKQRPWRIRLLCSLLYCAQSSHKPGTIPVRPLQAPPDLSSIAVGSSHVLMSDRSRDLDKSRAVCVCTSWCTAKRRTINSATVAQYCNNPGPINVSAKKRNDLGTKQRKVSCSVLCCALRVTEHRSSTDPSLYIIYKFPSTIYVRHTNRFTTPPTRLVHPVHQTNLAKAPFSTEHAGRLNIPFPTLVGSAALQGAHQSPSEILHGVNGRLQASATKISVNSLRLIWSVGPSVYFLSALKKNFFWQLT